MGFCVAGLVGDCGTEASASISLINDNMNKTVNDFFVGQTSSNQAGASQRNLVSLKTDKGNITYQGGKQENVATVKLESWQKMQNDTDIKNMLKAAVENGIDASVSAASDLLANPANAELVADVRNISKNIVENQLGVEQINECIATSSQENIFEADTGEGDIVVLDLEQKNVVDVAASCVVDVANETIASNESIIDIVNKINANIAAEQQGLWNTITDTLSNLFSSLQTIAIIIGIVIVIAIIGFLLIFFIRRRGKKKAPSVPEEVKKTVKQAAKTATKTAEQVGGYVYNMMGGAGKPSTWTIVLIILLCILILGLFGWGIWYFFLGGKKCPAPGGGQQAPGAGQQAPGGGQQAPVGEEELTCDELFQLYGNTKEEISNLQGDSSNEPQLRELRNIRDLLSNEIAVKECPIPPTEEFINYFS